MSAWARTTRFSRRPTARCSSRPATSAAPIVSVLPANERPGQGRLNRRLDIRGRPTRRPMRRGRWSAISLFSSLAEGEDPCRADCWKPKDCCCGRPRRATSPPWCRLPTITTWRRTFRACPIPIREERCRRLHRPAGRGPRQGQRFPFAITRQQDGAFMGVVRPASARGRPVRARLLAGQALLGPGLCHRSGPEAGRLSPFPG